VTDQTANMGWLAIAALPALLGILAGWARPEKPATTSLLMVALAFVGGLPFLGEGAICVIMIAPFYIAIGMIVAAVTGGIVRARRARGRPPSPFAVLLLLIPAAASWADPHLVGAPPVATVADSVVVDAPRDAVWSTLAELQLRFDAPPPVMLATLLPRPIAIDGHGAGPGAVRRVIFDNGTLRATVTRADPPRRFDVDLGVENAGREFFDHWATLVDSSFSFDELPGARTRITHVTRYRPRVSPRWYFAPFERLFASTMQRYLLDEFVRQRFVGPGTGPAVAAR
jgi:hypothetical protein